MTVGFDFEISADPKLALKATDTVEKALDKIEKQSKKYEATAYKAYSTAAAAARNASGQFMAASAAAESTAMSMGDILLLAGEIAGLHMAIELVDGYTEISNKLRVVSTDQGNLNGLLEETYKIAQDTRNAWDQVVSTYQRLANVTHGLGLSQREVLDLTKEMAQAAKVSGASTQEAGMAMSEITHAFATGAVQGREFRVLMRDVPAMMHELQVASGKTTGEFAEMGKHGHITAQLLIDWFGKAKTSIEEKFGKTIATTGDMLTMLHNAAEKFFGETATGAGIMKALSDATHFVVDNFEIFGKTILGVGEAVVGLYVIEKVITLVKLLTAAIAANPLGALLTALVVGISLLRQFGDEIFLSAHSATTMGDALRVIWSYITEVASSVRDFLDGAWHDLTAAFSEGLDSAGIELSLGNVLRMVASFVLSTIAVVRHFKDIFVDVFGGLPVVLAQKFDEEFHGVVDAVTKVVNQIIDVINKLANVKTGVAGIFNIGDYKDAIRERDDLTAQAAAIGKQIIDQKELLNHTKDLAAQGVRSFDEKQIEAEMARLNSQMKVIQVQRDMLDAKAKALENKYGPAAEIKPLANIEFDRAGVAGAADSFRDKIEADRKAIKDEVTAGLEKFDADMADETRKRNSHKATPGTIGTAKGNVDPAVATKEQETAMRKLENELRSVMAASNPIVEAQEKLAKAEDITTQAVKAGLISWAQAGTIMDDTTAKLKDQLDPMGAIVTKLLDQMSVLNKTDEQKKHDVEMTAITNELTKQGLTLTTAQIAQLDHLVTKKTELTELYKNEHEILQKIVEPTKKYRDQMEALEDLQMRGKLTAGEYAAAVDEIRVSYLQATAEGKTFAGGLELGFLDIKAEVMDVGKTVHDALVNAFHGIENALVDLVVKGKADWKGMVDSMLSDWTRVLIKTAENGIAHGLGLPGFATGGSFTVGGSGGTDTSLVAFRATPGETVHVTTPMQTNGGGDGGGSSGAPTSIHLHMHNNPTDLLPALETTTGKRIVSRVGESRSAVQQSLRSRP